MLNIFLVSKQGGIAHTARLKNGECDCTLVLFIDDENSVCKLQN